jgi:hypothetical protein
MKRALAPLLALVLTGSLLLSACGGGGSTDANRHACELVKEATDLLGAKHTKAAELNTKLDDAVQAALDAKNPKVRAAARNLQDLLQATTTTGDANSSFDFSRVGALNTLLQRCQVYLR